MFFRFTAKAGLMSSTMRMPLVTGHVVLPSPWLRSHTSQFPISLSGRNLHLLESSAFSAFALEEEELEDQKFGTDENSWLLYEYQGSYIHIYKKTHRLSS